MNTQKSVFKKLSQVEKVEDKVELSEVQKVELALIDDIQEITEQVQDNALAAKEWVKSYDAKVLSALRSAIVQISAHLKQKPISITTSVAENVVRNAISQGKDLGVDMKNNPWVKRLENSISDLKEANKLLDKTEALAEIQIKKLRG